VQDFDPKVQEAVNRIQPFALTREVAAGLRGIGVRSLNLDLMYGLPYQTAAGVARTAEQALELAPERLAVFGYAHVPWMMRHQEQIPVSALPGPAERLAQLATADRVLTGHGYRAVGLDHYARQDDDLARALVQRRLHRNFQGYTTDAAPALIGFGASAIGSLPQGYAQNATPVPHYREQVRAGHLPVARGIALTAQDRLRRAAIEQIMCYGRLDAGSCFAGEAAAGEMLREAAPRLAELAADGLVTWDGAVVAVTPPGRPFLRSVAAAFDTYLRADEARHARAL
jgi:oxygen-independent coproporphyrinogen-3 oxidase